MRKLLAPLLVAICVSFSFSAYSAVAPTPPPKLVLLIVIDQFRADTLSRFKERFLPPGTNSNPGGFLNLMQQGAYYPLAEYDELQCMTGPGHSTVLSGALPYQSGIPTNLWFDYEKNERVYCAQDPSTEIVGVSASEYGKTAGTSPKNFLGTTVGDELKNSGHPSKVIAIALKDRASIFMGGHRADAVIWHERKAFRWVSSRKYFADGKLPDWVESLNKNMASEKGQKFVWGPEGAGTGLTQKDTTLDPKKTRGLSLEFPKTVEMGTEPSLSTPYGVRLTADATIAALKNYKLGTGKATDLLAVSLSSHDYAVHALGPNSREAEEMTVYEDRQIARILKAVAAQVPGGLDNVVVALTADHAGGHNPELLKQWGAPGGRIDDGEQAEEIDRALVEKFGKAPNGEKWVPFAADFNFYFNRKALAKEGEKALFEAEEIAKKIILKHPGVAYALSTTDIVARRFPRGRLGETIDHTFFPGRSGDVMIIPKSGWVDRWDNVTHMTGYSYDRYVPLIIRGAALKAGKYAERAKVIDLAPTLSFILGVTPPSLSEGRVLSEAFKR